MRVRLGPLAALSTGEQDQSVGRQRQFRGRRQAVVSESGRSGRAPRSPLRGCKPTEIGVLSPSAMNWSRRSAIRKPSDRSRPSLGTVSWWQTSSAGFTRLDLLGLGTGILLIVATLLPAWGSARDKSLRTACVDQLKQIGAGFRFYAHDHAGRFPMNVSTNEGGSADYLGASSRSGALFTWTHFRPLSNYLVTSTVLVCPTDAGRNPVDTFRDLERPEARNAAISYGVGTESDESLPNMLLAADRSIVGGFPAFEFDGAAVRGNIGTNLQFLATLGWATNGLHRQAGNAAVADGSVRPLSTPGLRSLMSDSREINNNYSQPGRTPDL